MQPYLKPLLTILLAIISGLTTSYIVLNFPSFIPWIIAIAIVSVLGVLIYKAFKKNILETFRNPRSHPYYFAVIILFFLIAVTSGILWLRLAITPPDQTIILVATFNEEGQNSDKYLVTNILKDTLSIELASYPDIEVKALGYPISELDGSDVAIAKGKEKHARVVIWGWYGVTPSDVALCTHFEILGLPKVGLGPEANGQIRVKPFAQISSFALQTSLSKEMLNLCLFTIGVARFTTGDWEDAILFFSDALNRPIEEGSVLDQSIVRQIRATALFNKGDYDGAIADYDELIQLKPNDDRTYCDRGTAYHNKGDYDRAIADFDKAIQLKPDNAWAYYSHGFAHGAKGEYDLAIADCDKAIQIYPNSFFAYNYRGFAYYKKGNYDRAFADYNKAIQLFPFYSWPFCNRGIIYCETGEYDRAIADFDKAIQLQPDCAWFHKNRGIAYDYKGACSRAIADFDKAIQLQPDDAWAYKNRGFAYSHKGEYNSAVADYDKVLELIPDDAWTYGVRGIAYTHKGEYSSAFADFDKALQLKPDYDWIYDNRGVAYIGKGEYDRAIADFDKAIQLQPDCAWFYKIRGFAYDNKGEYDRAIADYNKSIQLKPDDASTYKGYAIVYFHIYCRSIADFLQITTLRLQK